MIDVRRLRVLRAVAQHGTLAAAAEELHLTPSAVSQQLAALEREVGQPVVERQGRGVRLTGAAEVLVGHADDADQGLGTFAGLRELAAGDEVVVRTASGRDLVYDVVSFERFAKAEVPMDRLFTTQGPHRLVLISCGGAFDPVRRTYADNVVVTAVPRR